MTAGDTLSQRHILVGVGGGIAAYKVAEVVSRLFQREAQVRVILTKSARQFISPLTFATLSRHQAYTDKDFWQAGHPRPLHILLGEWADLFLIAPLTANTLAKLVNGFADNLLTNAVLASTCPVVVAPAMNTDMWLQQSVQENWKKLATIPRYHPLYVNTGLLACDRHGQGRMAEASEIMTAIESIIYTRGKRDLTGKNILISGGGTREYIDTVRFLGNPATGKMAIALASACYYRGGNVTLVAGNIFPELLKSLPPIQIIPVTTAQQMEKAMLTHFPQADIVFMAAAVADLKPKQCYSSKLSKKSLPLQLELEYVTDIVAHLASIKQTHQKLIGFAAQTGDIVTPALEKLSQKKLDAIVANPIDKDNAGFATDTNEAVFIAKNGIQTPLPPSSKLTLAHRIIDLTLQL
ncbi:MAG: bifunctional phosphopantothenoylcysteine decarboxylase/phosphopantothenate--cysteine ligase CoaBC [Geminocystis sp.]|nr:bifunctional phosphopantothenoylcysteine decarboxylase/phosphopantothenate--cysteine ligase CoaBC [Geminocystis sp.]HIK37755.1 bifunctional phosphopantothenoylcysteine decarboxylase/phosphopantothenate--cysteine ligase CoaBC [Geminocystis sp. M7585_C2015_104]MCS7148935.1 bifunctional phosphopantothenoylcysteine decarboxylase/phosphopantothenate--cysteine ligase CoaBC [Geminocystis sp.]MCX8077442.1 bifunctional phosphopantothenoylcysteine decarboxylase/phosphopantothenate--cysteine ligase CoaB